MDHPGAGFLNRKFLTSNPTCKSFVSGGVKLVRRQELPAEATLSAEEAAQQLNPVVPVAVLSHGWLAPGHPDPASKRRDDLGHIHNDRSRED